MKLVALPSGQELRLTQATNYPRQGRADVTLGLCQAQGFALRLRIPGWSNETRAWLNGEPLEQVAAGDYLALEREWQDGDVITLELDMSPRAWMGEREAQGKVCLYRGPLLLAHDRRFNQIDPDNLPPIDPDRLNPTLAKWSGPWPEPWLPMAARCACATLPPLGLRERPTSRGSR